MQGFNIPIGRAVPPSNPLTGYFSQCVVQPAISHHSCFHIWFHKDIFHARTYRQGNALPLSSLLDCYDPGYPAHHRFCGRLPSANTAGTGSAGHASAGLRDDLPYHPILNLVVWPWFAWWYLRSLSPDVPRAQEGVRLRIFWVVITIIVDLVGWVLIPHPWQMTFKKFYVDYQPWINIIYLIILLTPRAVAAWVGKNSLPQPSA